MIRNVTTGVTKIKSMGTQIGKEEYLGGTDEYTASILPISSSHYELLGNTENKERIIQGIELQKQAALQKRKRDIQNGNDSNITENLLDLGGDNTDINRTTLNGVTDGLHVDNNEGKELCIHIHHVEDRGVDAQLGVKVPNNKPNKKRLNVTDDEIESTLQKLTTVPDELEDIIPRSDQVWNFDEIGIDLNGKWYRVICPYKWCDVERV